MVGMSAAVHELNHGTVFKTKRINEFFYKLFCFLTWNNPVHFRASHALHHQYTVYREVDKEVIQEPVKLVSQKAANSRSNCSTAGPPINMAVRRTC